MESRLKPGTAVQKRTRSRVERFIVFIILLSLLASTGCAMPTRTLERVNAIRPLLQVPRTGNPTLFVPLPNPDEQGVVVQATPVPQETPLPALPPEQPATAIPQPTAEPPRPTLTLTLQPESGPAYLYYTQAGDTLHALSVRFGVRISEIESKVPLPETGFLDPGLLLIIPNRVGESLPNIRFIPDSEIVFSPSALEFDIADYVNSAGGFLSRYKELRSNGRDDSANTVHKASIENSINPRLLLAILQYQSGWVLGEPYDASRIDYPISPAEANRKGLYTQLSWAVQMLNLGYYGWRDGRITSLTFVDGSSVRLAPDLNAGTVAVMYLLSQIYGYQEWQTAVYSENSLPMLYSAMFGNPWERAKVTEPLFPATLSQPELEFPFAEGQAWALTGGPHSAWGKHGALAAVDFAPPTTIHGCYASDQWVTSVATGIVARVDTGVVVVDLDGDGYEQTGWNILYLHIASNDKLAVGDWVNINERIGHPSCEGGSATGTHVHIARKYNGEWIEADGPLPMVLSGWTVHNGAEPYLGSLTKADLEVQSSLFGEFKSVVRR